MTVVVVGILKFVDIQDAEHSRLFVCHGVDHFSFTAASV